MFSRVCDRRGLGRGSWNAVRRIRGRWRVRRLSGQQITKVIDVFHFEPLAGFRLILNARCVTACANTGGQRSAIGPGPRLAPS
ncbi:uncharacterized protein LOC128092813 isoform X2 [Culex pipiens pallens]|uniref:uncharacterized protein LOC128092813 isoform X2 n=1 Tax=Culex pipiens pallens TaxID=42434 RepID=UPI0022AA5C56|nr:uncharacterized protein LOC128092813 isoform X2 [Culex pipiens pallens]